jgi:hypothetical protein
VSEEELDQVLRAIADWGPATLPLQAVPGCLGLGLEDASAITRQLIDRHLVEIWPDSPLGPSLVLTSTAAARLRIELVSPNRVERRYRVDTERGIRRIHWCEVGRAPREKPPPSWPDGGRPEVLATDIMTDHPGASRRGLDGFSDPRIHEPVQYDVDFPWRHTRVLGSTLPGWTPAVETADPCVICAGKRLGMREYCLGCGRIFAEWELGAVPPEERPRTRNCRDDGLGGGVGAPGKKKVRKQAPLERAPAGWRLELRAWREARRRP